MQDLFLIVRCSVGHSLIIIETQGRDQWTGDQHSGFTSAESLPISPQIGRRRRAGKEAGGEKPVGRVRRPACGEYADVLVSIKDEDFFIDFLVAAPNDINAKKASQQVGIVVELGELSKHKAVLSHYDVPLHLQHQIVPFVMETSGS